MGEELSKALWSNNDFETLHACPICQSKNSFILFNSLVDIMQGNVENWNLNKCCECGVAYLSPRPDEKNIIKAYINYYTHDNEDDANKTRFRCLINDLKRILYIVKCKKKHRLFELFLYFFTLFIYPFNIYLNAKIRHIYLSNDKGRLLDVGCGNGDFLLFAKDLGWDAFGLDIDKGAVKAALYKGVKVQLGSVETLTNNDMFDVITLSHVIEHVHNPKDIIQKCYEHLNPGGMLWLETPNINSIGLDVYKKFWRGLEPPRHLILFNIPTLLKLLTDTGFSNISQKTHGLAGVYMGLQSEKNVEKCKGNRSFTDKLLKYPRVFWIELIQLLSINKSEFITLIAYK